MKAERGSLDIVFANAGAVLLAGRTALGRVGEPDDVGSMVAGLLSDDNRWIDAQNIEVAGGYII